MKKTTLLLIGAVAFILQSASAQYTAYYDDFEGQTVGGSPNTTPFWGANTGTGPESGVAMWGWVGAGGGDGIPSSSFTVQSVLSTDGIGSTLAAVLDWTEGPLGGNNWGGFSQQYHASYAGGTENALSDLTLSFDVNISGNDLPMTDPVTVWFDQYPGGTKTFDASWGGDITDTDAIDGAPGWYAVSFTLDQLTPSGTSGAYNPNFGFQIAFDGSVGLLAGANGQLEFDNIVLTANNPLPAPEPTTIALLTLGGLGALVGIRRRRA
ncbi:MAG: PEP-CTERM sorting domain-containing protein [Verrucomicrobiia bacterium]